MAKRKKKKGIFASFFGFGSGRTTKAHLERRKLLWLSMLNVFILLVVLAAIGTGLFFLEKYVVDIKRLGEKPLKLELVVNAPDWLSEDLKHKIYETAGDAHGSFRLDDDTASTIEYNLSNKIGWLHDIKVKTDGDKIRLSASYYRPLVLIENGSRKAFLAADKGLKYEDFKLVVLDYVPVYDLPIITLKGVNTRFMPSSGGIWDKTDAHSAVELVRLLALMDEKLQKRHEQEGHGEKFKPLLKELRSIDVSNFNGRKSVKKPHIVLYAIDGTAIYWGALEGGLEAEKAEKLGSLYQSYEDYGTLQAISTGQARYIDLRIATKSLPIP